MRVPMCPLKVAALTTNVAQIGVISTSAPAGALEVFGNCSGSRCAWWRTESAAVVADGAPLGRCGAAFTGPADVFPDPAHKPAAKG